MNEQQGGKGDNTVREFQSWVGAREAGDNSRAWVPRSQTTIDWTFFPKKSSSEKSYGPAGNEGGR